MKVLIVIAVIAAVIAIILIIGKISEKQRELRFRGRLEREFSKPLDFEYSRERENAMQGYFLHHKDDGFFVDDITWNDFGVSDFIMKYNHSYSSPGDEYLYYRLRTPVLSEEEGNFAHLEETVSVMEKNKTFRQNFQVIMARLGRSGKFSLYTYLDFLSEVEKDKPVLTILSWLVYIAAVVLMFFNFFPGLMLMIFWVCVNVVAYLIRKKKIEPYFNSFTYILRLLKATDACLKILPDEFEVERKALKEAKSKLRGISSGNIVFLQSGSSDAVTDIGNGLMNFIKMFFHLDIFIFYRMKEQIENNSDAVDTIFTTLGKMDMAVNIASYRAILPYYSAPEFSDKCVYETEEMIHPLLLDEGVANSISVHKGTLLTGSNASGKSTFLRMIGLNALLAQSMHTVYAKKYNAGFFRIYSSMSLQDSLQNHESYYMAEIKSVKRILEQSEDTSSYLLCFVDEVLRGTNTKERIAAGAQIMRYMQQKHTLCFAATHDIELAHMLPPDFENYHFDEEIEENDISFPYRLKEGYATSRNAIALLRIMGYPDEIVKKAGETVETL